MPSLIQGYEYDIFISYRHNDNRSDWVTEFVESLREELATIIKDPVSVYFDSNLYDGLLETHHVDKSLEGKLKSLLLIPVLSQIYCDPKSFAWQHEFCAFNKLASGHLPSPTLAPSFAGEGDRRPEEGFGRDIKLANGNVASRILPIVIHQLDPEDLAMIESEINTKLRSIDFTFRAAGVNRPLRKDDRKEDNIHKLSYHDQLNKLANAIKEILMAIRQPGKETTNPPQVLVEALEEKSVDEKSIVVLPFVNLSRDPAQDYFADGIAENILNQLASQASLRVISRTSALRYKNSQKSVPEIARELGVKFVVEGSAQVHKDKVRISVQLINSASDMPLWSKVFTESLDDLFEVQDRVAEAVATELNSSISKEKKETVPTHNREAYDLFLKGRHAFNQWSVEGYKTATAFFSKAIALDPQFQAAYSYLASSYSARLSWNGDLAPQEAEKNIVANLEKAWQLGATENDYLTKAYVAFFIHKNFEEAEKWLAQALELNANNTSVLYAWCYLYALTGKLTEAQRLLDKARQLDPLTVGYFNYQIVLSYLRGDDDSAINHLQEAMQLYPSVLRLYDFAGRIYLTRGDYQKAVEQIEKGFSISPLRPPSMVAYLACAHAKLHHIETTQQLLNELKARSEAQEKGVNIYAVHVFHTLGDEANAKKWLAKARHTNDVDLIWLNADPLLKNLPKDTAPDFQAAERIIAEMLERDMPTLPYHNIQHVRDVVSAASAIAAEEEISDEEKKLLHLAALLHDIGFVQGANNHEAVGAAMARELLPSFGLTDSHMEAIAGMIMATRLPQSPTTLLEKILCDADLDYLGRDDFYEIGGRLFAELKEQEVVETEREWNIMQRTFLQSHRYHTHFGQTNREQRKQERLQEISAKLKSK
jgi:TolB-like protein/predicted metal-dependent HD superfamily phosphohydrolase/Tfp pilus assembly protein PilF